MIIISYDLSAGKHVNDLKGHEDSVHAVLFNHEQNMLVSAGSEGIVRLWSS